MNETFREADIRSLYRLLGHAQHVTRLGCLDYTNHKYEETYVDNEQAVVDFAKRWNGLRNCFIGRSFRNSVHDPVGVSCISFDIDPIRPKETASSDEQHSNALKAGNRILGLYPGGYSASSGNGCLLVYRLPSPISDLQTHYQKESVLIKELQELVNEFQVKIDSTNYDQAVIKLIGTLSTKGQRELHRCSKFIRYPVPPFANCEKLCARLGAIDPPKPVSVKLPDIHPFDGDRSRADFHLACWCKDRGLGPADTVAVLRSNPFGKMRDEKYEAALVGKVFANSKQTEAFAPASYFEELFREKSSSDEGQSISTGFKELDRVLGPFPAGELVTFAARSGYGKTTLACTIASSLRQKQQKVLYFSTEMAAKYLMDKLLAIETSLCLGRIVNRQFLQGDMEKIKSVSLSFERVPVIICDEFKPSIEFVKERCQTLQPDLVIYDHINQSGTGWQEVAEYTRKLKEFAKDTNTRIMLLAQLNEPPRAKNGEEGQSIRGDIRGSQEIIHLSSAFVFLSDPFAVKGLQQPVIFNVAKNRYGISGAQVELYIDKEVSRFYEKQL